MKKFLKTLMLSTLALIVLVSATSCGLSAEQLEKKLDAWVEEYDCEEIYYEKVTQEELDELKETLAEDLGIHLNDSIVNGWWAADERDGRMNDETWACFFEFETKADAEKAQDCFEGDEWKEYSGAEYLEKYTVIRKGKIVICGNEYTIEDVLD